jgi:hypothetical protein
MTDQQQAPPTVGQSMTDQQQAPPTVGRIVRYRSAVTTERTAFAAIVTAAEGHVVNLTVFPPYGPPYQASNVRLGSAEIINSWFWPPRA